MKKGKLGPILITPSLLFIFFALIFPLILTVYCSLFRIKYVKITDFVGLDNYINLLTDDKILYAIIYTLVISIISVVISIIIGFLIALWINSLAGMFAYLIQVIGLIPWVTSMIVAALLWKWIFNKDIGLLNYLLTSFGLEKLNVFESAITATIAIIFVITWRTIGYSMIMLLAGLKSIPNELEEAAKVDGANKMTSLFNIKIPMIKTPLLISAIVLLLSNYNNVTIPMTLTAGGPADATNVITLEMYRQGFTYYNFGIASAISSIIFIINIILIILYVRMVRYDI